MVGYYSSTMVVGGGRPGQAPAFQYRYFISINYVGRQNIKVISAAKLPTRFDTLTFHRVQSPAPMASLTSGKGCSVDYEGHTYQGYLVHPHEGPGQTISK
jgi:hypothetical protein